MTWSITEVARMSTVTSRTLRHYDAIGLLPPARTADGGRRYYEQAQLSRLQQILILRDLGLGLGAIAEVLREQSHAEAVDVLRRHRDWLLAERQRLERLLRTVDDTITSMEREEAMDAEKLFDGFEHNPYEAEARQKWGDAAVDDSRARMQGWSATDAETARTGYPKVHQGLAPLLSAGIPVEDDRVQQLIDLHFRITSLFWTPSAEAYRNLGQLYVDDERYIKGSYTRGEGPDAPALAVYMRDAMVVYAQARLS